MKHKRQGELLSGRARVIRRIISVILIFYCSIVLFLLIVTLLGAFKEKTDLVTNLTGWPRKFTLDNFIQVFTGDHFLLYFRNSILITGTSLIGGLFLSSLTAYGMSRFDFKGKSFLSMYFLIGMMVPIQVCILPVFLILKKMALLNTLRGLILVYVSQISLSCFIFQKFFAELPISLEEAARIEGAGYFRIYAQIVLPLSKPIIFTVALLNGIGNWNDFYMPMVLLGNQQSRTLTLAIYQYLGQFMRNMNVSFAAVIITLIPIIILYFAFSSQMMEGMTAGAVKG